MKKFWPTLKLIFKNLRGPLIALVLGSAVTIILFLVAELFFRLADQPKPSYARIVYSNELMAEAPPPPRTNWPLKKRAVSATPTPWTPDRTQTTIEGDFRRFNPDIGFLPLPGGMARVRKYSENEELIYDVWYGFDHWGRRQIGSFHSELPPALFLGCSFTLGEGVQGGQSFAARFGQLQTQYRPLVHAFQAWGPSTLLRLVTSDTFDEDLRTSFEKNQNGIAIYTFIDHHLMRTIGGSDVSASRDQWLKSIPVYELDGDVLNYRGLFRDARPLLSWFYYFYHHALAKSALLTAFAPHLPIYSSRHIDLMVAVIAELKSAVLKKTGIATFKVMIYPGSSAAQWVAPRLKARGIDVLDYSSLRLEDYASKVVFKGDSHPTAEAHEVIGKLLVHDLAQ